MARFGTTVFPRIRIGIGAGRYIYLPVLTTTQRNLLSASAGYLVYNSTTTQVECYNGSSWVAVGKLYGDATFLPLAGGTLTGNIAMAGAQTVDGVDISDHAADPDAHHSEEVAAGRAKSATVTYLQLVGLYDKCDIDLKTMTADVIYYQPMVVRTPITIDGIVIEVTTAASAGKLGRLGLFKADTDWQPTDLVKDAGTVAIDANAVKTASFTAIELQEGRYLLAFNCNESVVLRGLRAFFEGRPVITTIGANPYVYSMSVAVTFAAFGATGTDWDTVSSGAYPFYCFALCSVTIP